MRWRYTYLVLMCAVLAVLSGLRQADPLVLQRIRLVAFDTFQKWHPAAFDPGLPVRIVDIDEASLAALGQWPWPRSDLARLIDRLDGAGAAAIAFDMVFPEPDRLSPQAIAPRLPGGEETAAVRAALARLPGNDEVFAQSIARAPVVMGFVGSKQATSKTLPPSPAEIEVRGDDPADFVLPFQAAVANLPVLTAGAHGAGFINWVAEQDQIIRKLPLLIRIKDRLYLSMAADALRLAQGTANVLVVASGAEGESGFGACTGIVRLLIGAATVPTDQNGQMWIRFSKSDPRRYLSAAKVLDGAIPVDEIKGRIILIGTSAAGLLDIRATPLEPAMPGVEAHAQAIEQMLTGRHLVRPDFATGAEIVLVLAVGALLALLIRRFGAGAAFVTGGIVIVGTLAAAWAAYARLGWLLDPVYPVAALTVVFVIGTGYQHLKAEAERNRVRFAFGHYMAPALVARLAADPSKLVLGGENRELTLMFADVRGFTRRAEGLTPQELTTFVIELFTPLSKTIIGQEGTIDKYIGDSVMAFWNAPVDQADHAARACRAALAMLRDVEALNARWAAEAAAAGREPAPVALGIGINTGICCVGNFGSEERFDYSVLGDPVNLASRLESLNKFYGVPIVVGETTAAAASDLALVEIDLVQVRGLERPVRVFALVGDEEWRASEEFGRWARELSEMLDSFRQRRFDDAATRLSALAERQPGYAKLWGVYRARIEMLTRVPPPADWNGSMASE